MRPLRPGWVVAAAFFAFVSSSVGAARGEEPAADTSPAPPEKAAEPKPSAAVPPAPAKATATPDKKAPRRAKEPKAPAPKDKGDKAEEPKAGRPSGVPEVPKPTPKKEPVAAPGATAPAPKDVEEPAPAVPLEASSDDDTLGPGPGQGGRKIRPADLSDEEPKATAEPPKPVPHTKGKAPKQPNPTLPPGATSATPDEDARRQIAGGPTTDDLSATKSDPELKELRDAERVLFPKPLKGAQAGFTWDLPTPLDDGSAPVDASGLPTGLLLPKAAVPSDSAKDASWLGKLSMPTLPVRLDSRVVKYLKFYRDDARGRNILRIWAKKCGKLAPALRAEFAKAGLPTDLVWLSLIESGHNPTIVSPAGAAGLWQFIPESGRMYGLTVDRWVDERLDPERSTEAAVRYLTDLRSRFGSWELAMAAYNMGHGGLLRAMRKFNTNDFWSLSRFEAGLPWETSLYVPKILATAIAMSNKKAFGIADIEPDVPLAYDVVWVPPNVDLADVARAADTSVEDVRALNAVYPSGRTPPSTSGKRFRVRVPTGRGLKTEQLLAQGTRQYGTSPEPRVVRFGDTLDTIATECGTTAKELAALNHLNEGERLTPGLVLSAPVRATPSNGDGEDDVVIVQPRRFGETERTRVFYRVISGDQLPSIAAAFGVAPSELAVWNAIDPSAWLQPGMALQVFVKKDADLSRVRALREHEVRVLVAGSAEFFEYFESQNGRKRVTVAAKKNETLAAVGKRYGMSAAMMERINRSPASTKLGTGERVVVYAKGPAEDLRVPEFPRPLSAISAPKPDVLPPLPPGGTP
jgi:membrane-bound lytic murein transglycosylase D